MLAVAVESSPVDKVLAALTMAVVSGLLAPVKYDPLSLVSDLERTALVVERQANDEGAELIGRARGINVGLEFAAWARVDLQTIAVSVSARVCLFYQAGRGCVCAETGVTYVEAIELSSHASSLLAASEAGEQGLRDGVDDAKLVGVERRRELGGIQLRGLAV